MKTKIARLLHHYIWPIATGLLAALLLLQLSTSKKTPTPTTQSTVDYAIAVRTASPSVVNIYTARSVQRNQHPLANDPILNQFFNKGGVVEQERIQRSLGSGVIARDDGYILTNNHIINQADHVLVLLEDGREANAKIVGSDPETDLAVLKIDLDNISAANFSHSDTLSVGNIVLAIGNPFGIGQTVTQGIVSAKGRYGFQITTYENYIQTDAAINPGNSGGALINTLGEVVGINSAIYTQSGGSQGIGLAIPAEVALSVMGDIIEHGEVIRGWLGIQVQELSPQLADTFGLPNITGIVVTSIEAKGPAANAGLQIGDIITHMGNIAVGSGHKGMLQIARTRPGTSIPITVIREGKPLRLSVVIGKRENQAE